MGAEAVAHSSVNRQQRSTSATVHACATQPRGAYGESASKISDIVPRHASSRCPTNPERNARATSRSRGCTCSQASTQGPISRLQTGREEAQAEGRESTSAAPGERRGIEHAEVSNEFEDLVAQSGRFPAGSYVVVVRVLTPQGLELDRGEVRIQLVNPTRIEPVSPSRPFGETPQIVTTPNPRFLWSADAGVVSGGGTYRTSGSSRFDGAASAEDAVEGFAS